MFVELIIFDLDGTLIDSSEDIAACANKTLKAMGHKELGLDEIKQGIGWGVKMLFERLMPGESPPAIDEARRIFLGFYGDAPAVKTYAYPGVTETLRHFRRNGKKMAIVTNKPHGLANRILCELDLSGSFELVVGGDSFENKKPHPEPLERVMKALNAAPEASVIVGDSPVDCESGKKAGMSTIGVSYGFRGAGELIEAGCDVIVDGFPVLKEILI